MALAYFISLAGLFLWRLFPIWSTAIPGAMQDTRLFLWNGWWFHYAITQLKTNPYRTLYLFHPFGARLISHDYPLWMNVVTYWGQRAGLSLISASNVWFATTWILTGICTYGLAKEVVRRSTSDVGPWTSDAPALAAGTLAMTHSYGLARAMQNWGQFNFYCIALFLWMLMRARRARHATSWILAGAALAWTAACHYYFLVFSVLVWCAVAIHDIVPYRVAISHRREPLKIQAWLLGLAGLCAAAAFAFWVQPRTVHLGSTTIGMESPENPLLFMWVLLIAWAATHFAIRTSSPAAPSGGSMDSPLTPAGNDVFVVWKGHLLLIGTALVLLSPLIVETLKLVRDGGYPRQSILWKTAPMGVNLFAFFIPNGLQVWWGPAVSRWVAAHNMDPREQAAALGWTCILVVLCGQPWKKDSAARAWLALAISSTVLALGTHLHLLEYNTWLPLPFFVLRLLPIVGNVRMPERWMALAAIAWSVVFAQAIVHLSETRRRPLWRVSLIATALVLFENWPGLPFNAPPAPLPIYARLKELPPGAVLTLPLYIGDSSIGAGDAVLSAYMFPWDHLWAQTFHQHPIVGGYVGRISRRILTGYKEEPFTRTILDLEEHKLEDFEPDPAAARRAVQDLQIRYVLAYVGSTDANALRYALRSLAITPIDVSGDVQLYEVDRLPSSN